MDHVNNAAPHSIDWMAAAGSSAMQLSLDRREIRLSHALGEFPHVLVDLPVGDVLCEYSDGRVSWVGERKTALDLASLRVEQFTHHLTLVAVRVVGPSPNLPAHI